MTEGTDGCREASFGLSVLLSFCAFGMVTILYILPRLRVMRREDAIAALVVPHAFRFIGLSFLVPGAVSSSLPPAFAMPAAYGDLVAAILALISVLALSIRTFWTISIVWIFNMWGAVDLLFCGLPAPDRYWNRPWLAGHRVLHSDSRCAPAARYPRADILAAAAASPLERRANLCPGHLEPDLQSLERWLFEEGWHKRARRVRAPRGCVCSAWVK